MPDLIRPLRGVFPGPALEPDATVRAQLCAAWAGRRALGYKAADLAALVKGGMTRRESVHALIDRHWPAWKQWL